MCSTAAGFGGTSCAQCPGNSYGAGGSLSPCIACGPGQVSPAGAPSQDYCQCPAGQGISTAQDTTCSVCPANTFSLGLTTVVGSGLVAALTAKQPHTPLAWITGLAPCQRCPDGRISQAGSVSPDDCGEYVVLLPQGQRQGFLVHTSWHCMKTAAQPSLQSLQHNLHTSMHSHIARADMSDGSRAGNVQGLHTRNLHDSD